MKILIMGGTRFVGKTLAARLIALGADVTLFTRGRRPIPSGAHHIKGDRNNSEDLKALKGKTFDVIIDSSGRVVEETMKVLDITGPPLMRVLYVSSAGVYENTHFFPVDENTPIDQNSRHFGKVETENWLISKKIPFTSFRPTYIYGPGNYNPIERWFFDRILNNRPVPIPGEGDHITQLGHVSDLADAMILSLENTNTLNKIYNCSGKLGITFKGIVKVAASACGKNISQIEIRSFNYKALDPKARKAFPLRISNFYTDISQLENDLNWQPKFDLYEGFLDSFNNDYLLNKTISTDFSSDDSLIGI